MDKKPIPLYISDSLSALETLALERYTAVKSLKKAHRFSNVATKLMTELLQCQTDQEKSYIIGRRYIYLMDYLFKITDDKDYTQTRFGKDYRKVQELVTNLTIELEKRYEELAKLKISEKNEATLSNTSTIHPDYIQPEETLPKIETDTEKTPIFKNTFITPVELFNVIMRQENVLLVDTRHPEDYEESRINAGEGHIINIPEDDILPGLSANTLGQRLNQPTQAIWNKRDKFDVIILLDWDTENFNYVGSKLERLRSFIVEWDFNRAYKQDPVVLSGGLKEFIEWYPTKVTNTYLVLSQTNSEIDELLTLDSISYPETGAGNINLKVHTLNSVGDLESHVKRDFGDFDELLAGLPARASRSEDQLPKDFSSSQEGVSAYRSLSQESLPKDYFSIESIAEPPPTTVIEFAPSREVIYEKDIDVPRNEEAEIKHAIEGDRTYLLHKARAAEKPILSDENKGDQKRIRSSSSDKISSVKPPAVDRFLKPPSKTPGVTSGDGYTGLRNVKNICYMNTMLQCLKVLPVIRKVFVSTNRYTQYTIRMPPLLMIHFAMLMKTIWEGTYKSPKGYYAKLFKEKIVEIQPIYDEGHHEDTFEFFMFIFNLLSEDCAYDLPRPKIMTEREKAWYAHLQGRSSFLVDTFYYQLKNSKICWNCRRPNLSFETDNSLMLSVPLKACTLEFLIAEYLKDNLVADYSCSDCKCSATIVNKKEIVIDPEVLVIVLKRYFASPDGKITKNESEVEFPVKNLKFGNSVYNLYSVAQHTGTVTIGHYYASVLLDEKNDTWVQFNDERITKYSCSVNQAQGIKSSSVGFFYVRESVTSKCDK